MLVLIRHDLNLSRRTLTSWGVLAHSHVSCCSENEVDWEVWHFEGLTARIPFYLHIHTYFQHELNRHSQYFFYGIISLNSIIFKFYFLQDHSEHSHFLSVVCSNFCSFGSLFWKVNNALFQNELRLFMFKVCLSESECTKQTGMKNNR